MRIPGSTTLIISAAILLSGCNLPLSTTELTPSTVAGSSAATGLPPAPSPSPSPPPAPSPTTSPQVSPQPIVCPVPTGSPTDPLLRAPAAYVQDILAFLDGGGSPHALQTVIQSAGLSPQVGLPLAQQDFNGDGMDDVAVTLLAPDESSIVVPGELYLFACIGQAYALAYTSPLSPDVGAPEIIEARDMNADGAADLLLAREACGAHTCFSRIEVLIWRQNTLVDVIQGSSDDLPYPSVRLVGPGLDGRYNVAVTGTGIGSAGAGPYRGLTRTWSWNAAGDAMIPGPDLALPSAYRIHVLNDADQADRDGNYATTLELYDQVVHDDTLQDWIDPASERANLSAYAMFREMLTRLQMGDQAAAQSTYQALQVAYPPASLGGAYALMGQAFWTAYQSSGSIGIACAQAQAFAQANETSILQPLYFGYANPEYTAADICPTASP